MKIWRRAATVASVMPVHTPPPLTSSLVWDLGDQYCTARGCTQKTGLACSYIGRKERPCPTGWCPEHRYFTQGAVFCPSHGRLLDGTADEFRESVRVDLGNVVPVVLAWIVQEVDAEISEAMLHLALEWHQALVLDPVHFGLVGVHRVRTWERAWKICENLGPTLRVAVVIEEAEPGIVEARINARPILRALVPWHENHGFGVRPETPMLAEAAVINFRERLLTALIRGMAEWRRANIGNLETESASLRGLVWHASTARGPSRRS